MRHRKGLTVRAIALFRNKIVSICLLSSQELAFLVRLNNFNKFVFFGWDLQLRHWLVSNIN